MLGSNQWIRVLFVLLAASLVINACSPNPTSTPAIQEGGGADAVTSEPGVTTEVEQTLIIGMAFDTGSLDPHDPNYTYSAFIPIDMVYEPLVVYNEDGSIGPGLAESWEISDDGLVWTFHLRHNVSFHDGTPFNADAVRWNMDRWLKEPNHSWLPITTVVDSIETPDDYTVILKMNKFYYPSIQDLTLNRPVRFLSPKGVDENGNFTSAIGTGPWRLVEWEPERRSVFVPYEDYWGEKPQYLKKVILEVIPDSQTRIASLLSGDIHLTGGDNIGPITIETVPMLQGTPNIQLLTGEGSVSYLLMMNYTRPPFNDVLVRKALNHAIDREAISKKLFQGLAGVAQGIFSDNMPYVTQNPEFYTYDPDQARTLLTEAGWTPGDGGILEKNGQSFKVIYILESETYPPAKTIMEVIQAELLEIGIDMEIRQVDFGGWSEAMDNHDYDMSGRITWGAPYDPHSSFGMFRTGPTGAVPIFADPQLDVMIDDVLSERDEKSRQEVYTKIWQFMDENAVAIPIIYTTRIYALNDRVIGFKLPPTEYDIDLTQVRIGGD